MPWQDYTEEDLVLEEHLQAQQRQGHEAELRARMSTFDVDGNGNINVKELRRAMLSDETFKHVIAQVTGSVGGLSSHVFDEIMYSADTNQDGLLQPEELFDILVSHASRLAAPTAPEEKSLSQHVAKVEHVKAAKKWAVQRLTTAHQRSGSASPSVNMTPSRSLGGLEEEEEDILGQVVREMPVEPEEATEVELSLEEMVERELKEQSELLNEITHRRDHGRKQLTMAKKVERKHQETMRYMGARHRELMRKISEKKIALPPLCACGVACLEPHGDNCANNCVFYKNPHAYEQALATLLASYEVTSL